ncbi:transcription factor IBH1-like isoform X2 [Solanum dulcamara]|uniref:transcription factor IBH1-like isoform X2 n=1 Tax=Solanum dulcamara TaxID=45834 RepID=UPI002485BE91|nr:transcription factor IBH1-like isoform X2 [Solanum dulcamara]
MTTTPRRRNVSSIIRTRFAYRFLRSLRKLNQHKKNNSRKQYNRVKHAAYASMASAVGSKRAWSRALLWKIQNRSLTRNLVKKKRKTYDVSEETGFGELRKLVPGGEVMGFYNLLDETADYIKCLTSQADVWSGLKTANVTYEVEMCLYILLISDKS